MVYFAYKKIKIKKYIIICLFTNGISFLFFILIINNNINISQTILNNIIQIQIQIHLLLLKQKRFGLIGLIIAQNSRANHAMQAHIIAIKRLRKQHRHRQHREQAFV